MRSVRSRIGIAIGMCALALLLSGNTVSAAEEDAESIWKTLGFKFAGAAEAGYTHNFNNPNTNLNQLRIFDSQANSFVPHSMVIGVDRPATAGSALDRVGFRARIGFGADARFSRNRTNYQPGTDNNELDVQELYAEYLVPVGNGLKILAGEMYPLIGYEVVNSYENPNFSRSFTFGLAQPFAVTGIRFIYPFASWVTVSMGVNNGWDNIEDNNRSKSLEYLVAFTPHEKFEFSVYGAYGAEQPNGNAAFGNAGVGTCVNGDTLCDPKAKRTVVGAIIKIKPTHQDTIVLEPYYGNEAHASEFSRAHNARWNAVVAYYIHDFNDQQQPHAFSFRMRGEIFEDAGGARACIGGTNFAGGANTCATYPDARGFMPLGGIFNHAEGEGTRQTLWGGTWTLQYKPAPALITRAEFRYDKSDQNVFLYGQRPTNHQETLSFSVVYLF
jgi:Putative beta-barrel porin-2, OmpL-like. bbp2